MKITRRKIVASRDLSFPVIPAPFDQYYSIVTDAEMAEITGYDGDTYPCEEVPGYDAKHIAWAYPKPEFEQEFMDAAIDIVELVQEGNKAPFLGYVIGDRLYPLSEADMPDNTLYEEYEEAGYLDDVTSSVDTGLEYWYLTKHGLGPGMMPSDCHVLDVIDDGWDTYILLDKMLTTEELRYYDIREKAPSDELLKANGINSCTDVKASFDDDDDDDFDDDDSDEYDSIPSFNYDSSVIVPVIKKTLKVDDRIANIIYEWYDIEDIWEDFDSPEDFASFLPSDIGNMIDACDDEALREEVYKAVNSCTDVKASSCEKVAEDEDSISYIVSDTEVDEDSEMFEQPEQEYSSADTAINGKQGKLPAVFSKANIPEGALVLDYGGGTVESEAVAQNYLDQFNATEMLFDPFNQTAEHNREVISTIQKNGGADIAVCSNVLNVIKEQDVRLDVLKKIKKLMKPNATAYITVYEGSGNSEGKSTQKNKSYQNNMKLGSYLEEVQSVFPDAIKKGAVIVAPNTSKTEIGSSTDIASLDLNKLETEIKDGIKQYFSSPQGGWPEDEVDDAVKDYSFVEIKDNADHIIVEVRAELSYDGMMNLSEILDKIIEQYDDDAYFEMITSGIMEAYIWDNDAVDASTDVTAAIHRPDDEAALRSRDYEEDPRMEDGSDEDPEPLIVEFNFDFKVDMKEDGYWGKAEGEDPLSNADDYTDDGITRQDMEDNFLDLLEWNLPNDPGVYRVKGKATLQYDYKNGFPSGYYLFEAKYSTITDFECTHAGKVESSTDISAMTEEELDQAILDGRPFSIEDFKKFKNPTPEGAVCGEDVKVGDVIDVQLDASEVNLGTVVEVLAVNDPKEDWVDYTFTCKVIKDPGRQSIKEGDTIYLHFWADEPIGYYYTEE